MHRAGILASFVAVTLASSARIALAQATATGDTVAHSAAESAPVVDTASRKLPVAARELLFENCAGRSQNPAGYVLPLLCGRRASGAFDFAGGDSVILVRNGRSIRLAARDFTLLGQLERRRRMHAVTGALIGGGLGVISAAFVQGSGPHADDGRIATTVMLGGLGAVIGGFSATRYWGDWPRTLQDLKH